MRDLTGQEVKPRITVQQFLELFQDLQLEVLAGQAGMGREIASPRIQKPGLSLAGDREYIHANRIQILGATEITYLARTSGDAQFEILAPILEKGPSLLLITKGREPSPELLASADRAAIPLLRTGVTSSVVINTITDRLMDLLAPRLSTHGSFLDVYGAGLLLVGESSVGKSESALDLVVRGHRLVSDDLVEIRRRGEVLIGRAPELLQYHMELRGVGIVNIKDLFGVVATQAEKEVDLVVEMELWREGSHYDRLGVDEQSIAILGMTRPYLLLPVAPARNIPVLLEVAVRNLLLKRQGVHTARAFAQRQMGRLAPEPDGP